MKKVTIYTDQGEQISAWVENAEDLDRGMLVADEAPRALFAKVELNEDTRRIAYIRAKDIRMVVVEPDEPEEEKL